MTFETEYLEGNLSIYFNMMNDGGAKLTWDNEGQYWTLFEIPLYGGEPRPITTGLNVNELIKIGNSWT